MVDYDQYRFCLPDYLRSKGIDPNRRFRCLNPSHPDRNPSMGYDPKRGKVHCFSCGADYDLYDLLMLDEHLDSSCQAFQRAEALFGPGSKTVRNTRTERREVEMEGGCSSNQGKNGISQEDSAVTSPDRQKGPERGNSELYLLQCFKARNQTDYFAKRGFSEDTITRFSLGFDVEKQCAVLPCDQGRYILRSVGGEKRYFNQPGQPSPLFGSTLLTGEIPVFLTEGFFDALSAEELGYRGAALNGAGNREKAAELLRAAERSGTHPPVLLLPDADAAGEQWADQLQTEFPWIYRCNSIPAGYKDLNDLLTGNRIGAESFLRDCLLDFTSCRSERSGGLSAADYFSAFSAYIARQRGAYLTGFPSLDRALDGGLYSGLYVLGAVSSLGKTAFCMQVADQLAKAGHPVLIFSLEMSAFSLMARSISRETFLSAPAEQKRTLAKTVRGVLDGTRYAAYSSQELEFLQACQARYQTYADKIYFREDVNTLEGVEQAIRQQIQRTGEKPVVFLDYLQILSVPGAYFTDKQHLDRSVSVLKQLSRELDLTIVAVSSFNRENYNLPVSMSAFKESGGIDYSADVLLGLQLRGAGRPGFDVDREKRKDPRELELKILKNRSGPLGAPVPFRYYPAYSYFQEA